MGARPVRWSDEALNEYDAAVAYLRERNPAAALRCVDALDAAIAGLARRNTGRPGRVSGTFEKSLPKWRYIIAYQILPDERGAETLYIVHIIHTSRDWPKGEWPKSS
jgi:plasmid stabilization system protein ParE